MGKVAPKVAPQETPPRPHPEWYKDIPSWMRRIIDAAKRVKDRPSVEEGEFAVRLRPNVFKHENTGRPAIRWKSNAWPMAFIRLTKPVRGTFRQEDDHWIILKPDRRT